MTQKSLLIQPTKKEKLREKKAPKRTKKQAQTKEKKHEPKTLKNQPKNTTKTPFKIRLNPCGMGEGGKERGKGRKASQGKGLRAKKAIVDNFLGSKGRKVVFECCNYEVCQYRCLTKIPVSFSQWYFNPNFLHLFLTF